MHISYDALGRLGMLQKKGDMQGSTVDIVPWCFNHACISHPADISPCLSYKMGIHVIEWLWSIVGSGTGSV